MVWFNPVEPKCSNGSNSRGTIHAVAIYETINISCPILPQSSSNDNTTYWWQFIADSSRHSYPRSTAILASYHREDTIKDISKSPQASNRVITFQVNSFRDYGTIMCGIQNRKDNCSFRLEPVISKILLIIILNFELYFDCELLWSYQFLLFLTLWPCLIILADNVCDSQLMTEFNQGFRNTLDEPVLFQGFPSLYCMMELCKEKHCLYAFCKQISYNRLMLWNCFQKR